MAKPRMTRADRITLAKLRKGSRLNAREMKRAPLLGRWLAYCDEVKYMRVRLDLDRFYHVIFVIPMPSSWSAKKRGEMCMRKHQKKPDKDNLEKALLDAMYSEDMAAWDGRVTKVWGTEGAIIYSPYMMEVDGRSILEKLHAC